MFIPPTAPNCPDTSPHYPRQCKGIAAHDFGAASTFAGEELSMKIRVAALSVLSAGLLLAGTSATWSRSRETVIHSFNQGSGDGFSPQSDLIADGAGNLYGTTLYGGTGSGSGFGTVFMLSPTNDLNTWNETVLYSFTGGLDGGGPLGGLALGKKGVLYGTASTGGAGNGGTVFQLSPPKSGGNWQEKTLYSFCSVANCADGQEPLAGVTIGAGGVLYGTTLTGGVGAFQANGGTVYQLTPPADKGGNWTQMVIHNFCDKENCQDGYEPQVGRLLLTNSGAIFGTASKSIQGGTLYSLTPNGGSFTFDVVHEFNLSNGDGGGPLSGVVADKNGVLYGTTSGRGENGCGTVYAMGGGYQTLYSFCKNADHSDGALPYAGVIVKNSKHGTTLYGTTLSGGIYNAGVVYKLTGQSETVLHSFCAEANCPDGSGPRFGSLLLQGTLLYGTASTGGDNNFGVVYSQTK